jgi:acyl carrier protein
MLESLPLTTNGKLDRSSLPEPDARRPKLEQSLQLPRTPAEEQVASIWRELLRTDQVGVYDNFFELGGHSLLLTQLASRILDTFRVRLPLRLLFDLSTIEEMTVAILKRQIEHTDKAKIDEMLAKVTELSTDEVLRLLKTR